MIPTSIIALFCDDIREEKSGALTLVGVMGDNVKLPPLPASGSNVRAMIPRLAVYIRLNFDVEAFLATPITFKIILPDGTEVSAGGVSEQTIAEARTTGQRGNQLAGIVSRLVFGGFVLTQFGRITVEVDMGGNKYLAGILNFVPDETAHEPASS
jgi:hypothetical protein